MLATVISSSVSHHPQPGVGCSCSCTPEYQQFFLPYTTFILYFYIFVFISLLFFLSLPSSGRCHLSHTRLSMCVKDVPRLSLWHKTESNALPYFDGPSPAVPFQIPMLVVLGDCTKHIVCLFIVPQPLGYQWYHYQTFLYHQQNRGYQLVSFLLLGRYEWVLRLLCSFV